jgi:hypothetical protein
MNVDINRTVCLEDISTMKQKNNWCSWCVRVFVGNDDGDWKTCGVGILSFKVESQVINTVDQLKKIFENSKSKESVVLEATVKKQEGLKSPSDKAEAEQSVKNLMRGSETENSYILKCDLKEAINFEWEKSKRLG